MGKKQSNFKPSRGKRGGKYKKHKECQQTETIVYNISDKPLTDIQTSVFKKGLSFVPTKTTDSFLTKIEQFKFFRNIRVKSFFSKQNMNLTPENIRAVFVLWNRQQTGILTQAIHSTHHSYILLFFHSMEPSPMDPAQIWNKTPETPGVTAQSADITYIPPASYYVPPGRSDITVPDPRLSPLPAAAPTRLPVYTPIAPVTLFGSPAAGSRSLPEVTGEWIDPPSSPPTKGEEGECGT
ncbi:UNVERIFIED_CONTAM: hypothetical protein FKN15_072754 [Acipenser sinensis]